MCHKLGLFYNLFAICNIYSLLGYCFHLATLQVKQRVLLFIDFLFADTYRSIGYKAYINLFVYCFLISIVE